MPARARHYLRLLLSRSGWEIHRGILRAHTALLGGWAAFAICFRPHEDGSPVYEKIEDFGADAFYVFVAGLASCAWIVALEDRRAWVGAALLAAGWANILAMMAGARFASTATIMYAAHTAFSVYTARRLSRGPA